ncbi:hypothetical protein LWC34_15450 [Kibdelosporangium philippinense]|uniref:Carboxypeptidase regulatory-like domain-containing protein n=1 Tax=Kibdelosporangium philippinense TaxID=211113 RepID=A0ABS8Z8S3_9PSEU|nr:hypothetical protein [Kibdelosporangium philippinense]MCE7004220.1 hypothetical protein [Kibdelosporangium philippinense]
MAEVVPAAATKTPGMGKALVQALWFPAFFVVGFMVFYLVPFHAPAPHHVPVAVVGQQAAGSLSTALEQRAPGAFDITAVGSEQAARQAVLDRDVVGAYDPGTHTLFVAKVNGAPLLPVLQATFASQNPTVVDLASGAPGDSTGTGLFYLVMVCNLVGYIGVMMLLQATAIQGKRKLLTLAGFGAATSIVVFATGLALDVIPFDLWLLPVLFLLTQATSWVTFGLEPLVRQYIPGVAMGLFVLMSIPSSGGAIPKEMVPGFFRALHPIMPLGQTIDAARGILYFDGKGVVGPLLGLFAWFLLGVGLLVFAGWRNRKTADAEAEDLDAELSKLDPQPGHHEARVLMGEVRDRNGWPVTDGTVTVTDHAGKQLGITRIKDNGTYTFSLTDVSPQYVTVIVISPRYRAAADRVAVGHQVTSSLDFVLDAPSTVGHRQPRTDVSGEGAAAAGSASIFPID